MRFLIIFVAVSSFCVQGRIIYSDKLTADQNVTFYSIVMIPCPVSHKSVIAHRINIDGLNICVLETILESRCKAYVTRGTS